MNGRVKGGCSRGEEFEYCVKGRSRTAPGEGLKGWERKNSWNALRGGRLVDKGMWKGKKDFLS